MYSEQIRGLAADLSILYEFDEKRANSDISPAVAKIVKDSLVEKDAQFWKARDRAARRMWFIT